MSNNTKQENAGSVLIVEDDEDVRESVKGYLELAGFSTDSHLDRSLILKAVKHDETDLIILDLGLPDDDGISIAAEIRALSDVPILMLTGRTSIRDRVTGFDAGADDYLVKPFHFDELMGRIRALLRRNRLVVNAQSRDSGSIHIENLTFDMSSRILKGPKVDEKLTDIESKLLFQLCNSETYISREVMYLTLFQKEWDTFDRRLDVHISHLRRKLSKVSDDAIKIDNLRGKGYKLNA